MLTYGKQYNIYYKLMGAFTFFCRSQVIVSMMMLFH